MSTPGTLVYSPGMSDAAYYEDGLLVHAGHTDGVSEWLLERLGVTVEQGDFVTDKSARGWSGVAERLEDVQVY